MNFRDEIFVIDTKEVCGLHFFFLRFCDTVYRILEERK